VTEEPRREASPWRAPLTLAGTGLLLLLTGYALLNYTPRAPADPEKQRVLKELRDLAVADPKNAALNERLGEIERSLVRPPPLRPAGVIAFYAGLLLFVAAGIKMYHSRPVPDPAEEEAEEKPS
jgi:hypothetical protein